MRVPFYLELALNDAQPDSINFYQMNADLKGLTSLQVLDKVVAAAASRGILIMLDLHSFKGGTFMQDGLWYDASHPESMVMKGWTNLAQRYKNQWNVFAADLKNEPWGTTWGTGAATTDWNTAAARLGNNIHQTAPSWLIFVEGTNKSPACSQACFWGENLQGVQTAPVQLNLKSKLVYSPHCYGPSVAYQDYFQDASFPNNMPAIWNAHYGFVPGTSGNAIVIGEWGGVYSGKDQIWMDYYVNYLKSKDTTDQFFWCLNPDSGDTGGLLDNDWKTPDVQKLALLKKLCPSPTNFRQMATGEICVTNA
jgi:endoglucanase